MMDYSKLCENVDELGQNLVCIVVVKSGKLIAAKVKPGSQTINEKRLSYMLTQAELMVGISKTAEDLLGRMEHVKVKYGNGLDVYLFPLEKSEEKTILGVTILRPYNADDLIERIVEAILQVELENQSIIL